AQTHVEQSACMRLLGVGALVQLRCAYPVFEHRLLGGFSEQLASAVAGAVRLLRRGVIGSLRSANRRRAEPQMKSPRNSYHEEPAALVWGEIPHLTSEVDEHA